MTSIKSKFSLNEMPRRIVPNDPELGFTIRKNNRKLATAIINSKKSVLLETTQLGNKLFKVGNKFILVDPYHVRVLYYLKWKQKYHSLLNSVVSQEVLHWRDRGVFESRNLTSHVFFDLLLPINGSVMTDFIHSDSGERFWMKVIDESFDRNLYIFAVDFLKNSVTMIKDKLDFNSLLISSDESQSNNPWGDQIKFEGRRIIISNTMYNIRNNA